MLKIKVRTIYRLTRNMWHLRIIGTCSCRQTWLVILIVSIFTPFYMGEWLNNIFKASLLLILKVLMSKYIFSYSETCFLSLFNDRVIYDILPIWKILLWFLKVFLWFQFSPTKFLDLRRAKIVIYNLQMKGLRFRKLE